MATERTPEERQQDSLARERSWKLVKETRDNLLSWHLSERLDESPEVCDMWVNKIWSTLREAPLEDVIQGLISLIEDGEEFEDALTDAVDELKSLT